MRRSPPGQAEIARAKKLARDGDLAGAAEQVKAALALDASLEEAHLLAGSLAELQGDAKGAAAAYDAGLTAVPRSAALHHARGMLSLEASNLAAAIEHLSAADGLVKSKDADIAADLAYALIFANRLEDAEGHARNARALAPKKFAAAFTLGEVLLRKKAFKEAAQVFKEAADLKPDEPVARRKLAAALDKAGDAKSALAVYDGLLREDAKDPRVHAGRAGALLSLGKNKEAVRAMKAAVDLAPDSRRLLELLLHTQKQAKDKKGARKTRKRLDKMGGSR